MIYAQSKQHGFSGGVCLHNANTLIAALFFLFFSPLTVRAESFRALIKETVEVSVNKLDGASVSIAYNGAALINLSGDCRFLRAVELEINAPQLWIVNSGTLNVGIYGDIEMETVQGNTEIHCRRLKLEALPNKIQTVYQIPMRKNHGLRNTPYSSVLSEVIEPDAFPILFRIMPAAKEIPGDVENMRFTLNIRPLLSDEGAVRVKVLYPDNKQQGPAAILIDNNVIERLQDETFLKEGEHFLTILSADYRNETRRFIVEQGKTIDLSITLHDLTPLIVFEAPSKALIYIDKILLSSTGNPVAVIPGTHEIKIQLSDYTIVKTLIIQKGKTYRVVFAIDLEVTEE
ncbi:MAG: hypothetical protein LBV52_06790 [Spirochaetaceae bacterium]|jgi:hypothetical protein|nr:hypothetical protein [Spirochaetaceae bacterium]